MHPVAIIVLALGGVFVCYGGYEAIHTLYEWHNDRKEQKEYEDYIRKHTEKSKATSVTAFEVSEDDDDDPLAMLKQNRDSRLRQRKKTSLYNEFENGMISSSNDIETSISLRKKMIEKENELLLQEEAELERKRELLRSRGNNITGVVKEKEDDINPFSSSSFILL